MKIRTTAERNSHCDLHHNRKVIGGMGPRWSWIDTALLFTSWWRHQMKTLSALLALCEEKPPVTGRFPLQKSVTLSFDVFFDLRLNKRLSKQSSHRWFETPSRSLWRHFDVLELRIFSTHYPQRCCCNSYMWCSNALYLLISQEFLLKLTTDVTGLQ